MAKVISVEKDEDEEFARFLRVRWYDVENDESTKANSKQTGSLASTKFFPCYKDGEKRRKGTGLSSRSRNSPNVVPWIDTIHTDTVKMAFNSLKKNHTLPVNVINHLCQ